MLTLRIYKVKDDYINYLRQFDTKVFYNKAEKRPYVGIVLVVNGTKYFAPLSSPKPKHLTMHGAADLIKLDNGKLGVINLNNMIPVADDAIIVYDLTQEPDLKYQNLLIKQITYINNVSSVIFNRASKLHKSVSKDCNFLGGRCCNYGLLEEKCKEYK